MARRCPTGVGNEPWDARRALGKSAADLFPEDTGGAVVRAGDTLLRRVPCSDEWLRRLGLIPEVPRCDRDEGELLSAVPDARRAESRDSNASAGCNLSRFCALLGALPVDT